MYELSPYFQLQRKTEYTGGKEGIAPFALNSTNHALTQSVHLSLKYANGNRYGLNPLDAIQGEDGQRIMDWLSAMINAHVDVAKDPYIMTLNVNKVTYNITSLLLRAGKGENTFYFLAQPALRLLTKNVLQNNGVIGAEKLTEKEQIKKLLESYMGYFYNLIEQEKDANVKQKYAQYYNQIAKDNGLRAIEGYDSVKLSYSDVFNKELAVNALKSPNSIYGVYQNVMSLIAYKELSTDTEALSQLVQLSQIDTKKFGNNIPLQLNFERRLKEFIENYQNRFYITNNEAIEAPLQYYLKHTFLKNKLVDATRMVRSLLANQVIDATPAFRNIFNAACDEFLGNSSNVQDVSTLAKALKTILRARIVAEFAPFFNVSNDHFISMISGENSVANQLTRCKTRLKGRNDLPALSQDGEIVNALLNYLQEYPGFSKQRYDRLVTDNNSLTNTGVYENRLISAYQDMLDCEDAAVRKFADTLGLYAYLTSFDNRHTNSFFNVLTTTWKKSKGYTEAIKQGISALNSDDFSGMQQLGFNQSQFESGNFTEIFTAIARNLWQNEKIVPSFHFNKYTQRFGLVQFTPNSKPMPTVFMDNSYNTRLSSFLKVAVKPNDINTSILYQKIGYIDFFDSEGNRDKKNRRIVYKAIPKLGFNDNGVNYQEFNKRGNELSAFPENSMPEQAILSDIEVETMLTDKLKNYCEKKHITMQFTSADAVRVEANQKVINIVQEEPNIESYGDESISNMTTNISDNLEAQDVTITDMSSNVITIGSEVGEMNNIESIVDMSTPAEIQDMSAVQEIVDSSVLTINNYDESSIWNELTDKSLYETIDFAKLEEKFINKTEVSETIPQNEELFDSEAMKYCKK